MLSVRFASLPLPRASDTRVYTLPNEISAIQIVSFDDKTPGLGPVSKLPRGARIEACGDGFDDQTVKVSHEGQFYYVFLQDLKIQRKTSTATA